MADVNKPKLQLRSGVSVNGDKTPSPATKLLLNHGKPNFTIQRSPKIQNGSDNPLSPTPPPMSDEFVVKSTKFNGVFKPSSISVATKQTLQQQQQNGSSDNEAAKVVLRRAKVVETEMREDEDSNVPEFIRRQRRIQERLANQNILDFENRRSGYFTQVMISPTNPNRQSFVETMASPAVMPGLEIPPPQQPERIVEVEQQEETTEEYKEEYVEEVVHEPEHVETVLAVPVTLNGHDAAEEEEEEVAKAIAEVNKAVEGEDEEEHEQEIEQHTEPLVKAVTTMEIMEEVEATPVVAAVVTSALEVETPKEEAPLQAAAVTSALEVEEHEQPQQNGHVEAVVTSAALIEDNVEDESPHNGHVEAVVTSAALIEEHVEEAQQNGHVEAVVTSAALIEEPVVEPKTNGNVEEPLQNGHSNGQATDNEVTISHTNGLNGPSIPSPDPSGEKGVNYEPKTVVSFSQEMGSDINKYPDTVKVMKDAATPEIDQELREMTKLKFEINTEADDIEVKSVLVTETA